MSLRDILGVLRDSYCRTIGVEYMHISDPEERAWIQQQMETPRRPFDKGELTHIMDRLNAAEAFETFLQTKFVGQKRFSLEGGEAVIPMLDAVLHGAAHDGMDEVAIGMSPPWPAQRALEPRGEELRPDLPGVRGQLRREARLRRRASTTWAPEGTYTSHDGKSPPRCTSPRTPRTWRP